MQFRLFRIGFFNLTVLAGIWWLGWQFFDVFVVYLIETIVLGLFAFIRSLFVTQARFFSINILAVTLVYAGIWATSLQINIWDLYSFAIVTMVGLNVMDLFSRFIGQRDYKKVTIREVVGPAYARGIAIWVWFLAVGILGSLFSVSTSSFFFLGTFVLVKSCADYLIEVRASLKESESFF
jgi:hypothetical protein